MKVKDFSYQKWNSSTSSSAVTRPKTIIANFAQAHFLASQAHFNTKDSVRRGVDGITGMVPEIFFSHRNERYPKTGRSSSCWCCARCDQAIQKNLAKNTLNLSQFMEKARAVKTIAYQLANVEGEELHQTRSRKSKTMSGIAVQQPVIKRLVPTSPAAT